jgi:uncharacterized protein YndB with AHSA1/START domain
VLEASESREIVIDAPIETVYEVITDFERYPEWASALKRASIVELPEDKGSTDSSDPSRQYPRVVEFEGGALGFGVRYKLEYEFDPPRLLKWRLVDGEIKGFLIRAAIRSLEGSYEFERLSEGRTKATYRLSVVVPLAVGPLRAKAEQIVMDTGLADLKKRAEQLAAKRLARATDD